MKNFIANIFFFSGAALTKLGVWVQELGIKMHIKFDTERETTTGTVSKGFQVLIYSPDNKEPVPWEAWSGGEAQRLRLAGSMGLASLILDSKGIKSNIEIFDEPSAYLSQSGIEDLVELLTGSYETLPTAALVHIVLDIDMWQDLPADLRGQLQGVWRPRELE